MFKSHLKIIFEPYSVRNSISLAGEFRLPHRHRLVGLCAGRRVDAGDRAADSEHTGDSGGAGESGGEFAV